MKNIPSRLKEQLLGPADTVEPHQPLARGASIAGIGTSCVKNSDQKGCVDKERKNTTLERTSSHEARDRLQEVDLHDSPSGDGDRHEDECGTCHGRESTLSPTELPGLPRIVPHSRIVYGDAFLPWTCTKKQMHLIDTRTFLSAVNSKKALVKTTFTLEHPHAGGQAYQDQQLEKKCVEAGPSSLSLFAGAGSPAMCDGSLNDRDPRSDTRTAHILDTRSKKQYGRDKPGQNQDPAASISYKLLSKSHSSTALFPGIRQGHDQTGEAGREFGIPSEQQRHMKNGVVKQETATEHNDPRLTASTRPRCRSSNSLLQQNSKTALSSGAEAGQVQHASGFKRIKNMMTALQNNDRYYNIDKKEQQQVRFRLLTYNIWMMPNLITGIAPKSWNLSPEKHARAQRIPAALPRDLDVIVFCEAFCEATMQTISLLLRRDGFLFDTIQPILKRRFISSGIKIYSKHRILETDFLIYDSCSGDEVLASKGCTYVKVQKQGLNFHVFGTHLQAWETLRAQKDRRAQLRQIRSFVARKRIPPHEPVLLAGDFNIVADLGSPEYHKMLHLLSAENYAEQEKEEDHGEINAVTINIDQIARDLVDQDRDHRDDRRTDSATTRTVVQDDTNTTSVSASRRVALMEHPGISGRPAPSLGLDGEVAAGAATTSILKLPAPTSSAFSGSGPQGSSTIPTGTISDNQSVVLTPNLDDFEKHDMAILIASSSPTSPCPPRPPPPLDRPVVWQDSVLASNQWCSFGSVSSDANESMVLDYIFVEKNHLLPTNARISTEYVQAGTPFSYRGRDFVDLSDHYPVLGDFVFVFEMNHHREHKLDLTLRSPPSRGGQL
ncbi:unnamed protein product [Amoebophrya sp. A25]|nr:unnamed protein product [Amoebophrya sp. A25]|eukprot:GSA25T00004571001.1